jgi:hypothetical protein
MPRIALVVPYFGKLPDIASYFFESASHVPDFDVLLFTDAERNLPMSKNVKLCRFTPAEFSDLASRKLGKQLKIETPYKLCDLKPAYGAIFQDFLSDYGFWGFGDVDVIYGDLAHYLQPLLAHNDVVSFRKGWISGSLCILRNCENVNLAYRSSANWGAAFTAPGYQMFDEVGGFFFNAILSGADVNALKGNVDSFTHVVKRLERDGVLRCSFEDRACEDIGWGETLLYNNGKITYSQGGAEVLYVHTVLMKRRFFFVPTERADGGRYFIRKTGVYRHNQSVGARCALETARVFRGGASCLRRLLRRYVG